MIVALIVCTALVVAGILGVIYAPRFWKRWARFIYGNKINPFSSWDKYRTADELKQQFADLQPDETIRPYCVWSMRIAGAALALAGGAAISILVFVS